VGGLEKDQQDPEGGEVPGRAPAPNVDKPKVPDAKGSDGEKPAQVVVNKWQLFALLAVMVTLVIVVIAGFSFKGNTDSVTGIIGAALPPFATIAAAIFGIKAVYDSGRATGEATGKAEGEKDKGEAVKDAKDTTARAITQPLRQSEPEATRDLIGHLRRGATSPHGYDGYQLLGPDPGHVIELPGELLDRAERPSHDVETALAIAEQYLRK
jgi:hypothetical protein